MGGNEAHMQMAALHPLGHTGQPANIADGVVFLASDKAAFVTGAELVIDGGMSAQ
jgi:NAD(P)-dependent dehydrogenase (short-subunit alcohol dehydrogenase family)